MDSTGGLAMYNIFSDGVWAQWALWKGDFIITCMLICDIFSDLSSICSFDMFLTSVICLLCCSCLGLQLLFSLKKNEGILWPVDLQSPVLARYYHWQATSILLNALNVPCCPHRQSKDVFFSIS